MTASRIYSGSRESIGSWISRLVMFVFGVLELLLPLRFFLLLVGANTVPVSCTAARRAHPLYY